MIPQLKHAGGIFQTVHRKRFGGGVDLSSLKANDHDPHLVSLAGRVWQDRVTTEFRSIQIMTRFLGEVLGAGDPLEVYAGAVELVEDEVRHTALCVAVCEALGVEPRLPEPVRLLDPEPFLAAPMAERALTTAISMLLVSETLSVGFIRDLQRRCTQPGIRAVLDATLDDEASHEEYGLSYVRESLRRFPQSTLRDWRQLVQTTLAPHRTESARVIESIPAARRHLDAWPEPTWATLGLLGPERQALVYLQTFEEHLRPQLMQLGLW